MSSVVIDNKLISRKQHSVDWVSFAALVRFFSERFFFT